MFTKEGKTYYVHRVTSTQEEGTNELWNTVSYDLHPNNARNISMGKNVHPKKKMPKKGKKARKRKEKKRNRNNNKHALRAQAESRGDKVAVCWYDQSCDMSS